MLVRVEDSVLIRRHGLVGVNPPPEHRAVILLKEIDGHQYNEIAEIIGISIGTVMSRLFYARKKLQSLLKDVYEAQ